MKPAGILVLGILVVLCFGFLWAYHGLTNNVPHLQDQQALFGALSNANHQIDIVTAIRLIRNHKTTINASSASTPIKGGVFARSAIEKLLAQPGAAGIRYYYARNDDGTPALVLVGVDARGQDMIMETILDKSILCPPFCPSSSELAR
jgi:hypothetical protein